MPCKGGYKKNIEASKLRRSEEKKQRESPAGKHWLWLVQVVYASPNGFSELSAANQAFFAVAALEGDVYNGGFDQYFFNSSGDYYSQAVSALMEMSATNTLRLLISAKGVVFGAMPVPLSTSERRSVLKATAVTEAQERERSLKLDALDELFWKDPDKLSERAAAFAERHGLHEDF